MKLEKFLELFWKEMLSKIQNYLYLTFLSRQLDNDGANDDENDISRTENMEYMKYH